MTTKRKLTIAVSTIVILGAVGSLPFVMTEEYSRVTSPDGRFYAVATCPIWQQYVPMAPGGGGDKSGYVTVYTRQGKSCGRAPVDMVWMIQDVKWSATNAELALVAEWDLATQTMERLR